MDAFFSQAAPVLARHGSNYRPFQRDYAHQVKVRVWGTGWKVYCFVGHLPALVHERALFPLSGFLPCNNRQCNATWAEISRAFGVLLVSIKRYVSFAGSEERRLFLRLPRSGRAEKREGAVCSAAAKVRAKLADHPFDD
jgi:hypothetical protein